MVPAKGTSHTQGSKGPISEPKGKQPSLRRQNSKGSKTREPKEVKKAKIIEEAKPAIKERKAAVSVPKAPTTAAPRQLPKMQQERIAMQ